MLKILTQTASDSVKNYLKLLNLYVEPQKESLTRKAIDTVRDYLKMLNLLDYDLSSKVQVLSQNAKTSVEDYLKLLNILEDQSGKP